MTDLTIEVKALTDEAIKGFKNIGDKIGDLTKQATGFSGISKIAFGSFIGSLASQATIGAFNIFKEGISSAVDLLKDSVKASAESQVALNQLNTSLALAGRYSKTTSDDFVKFASELQATTTFEDDLIIKNAAVLESFAKLDSNGLKKATKAALDMSAATGVDLSTAMNLLGKAAIGSTEMLARQGVVIKKTGDTAKDFQSVLDTINKQFGGAAEQQVNTYSGAMIQLENVFGDFKESLGDIVTQNPLVISGIKILKDVFVILKGIIEENKEEIKKMIGEGFIYLVNSIPSIAKGVNIINESFVTLRNTMSYLYDLLASLTQKFLELGNLKLKFDVLTSFGAQKKLAEDALKLNQDQIASIKQTRDETEKDVAKRLSTAESFSATTLDFSKKVSESIKKEIELNNKKTDSLLVNLSKENEGKKAADKNEEERIKKRETLLEENRKTALAYMEQDKKFKEDLKKQNEGVLSAGIGAFSAKNETDRNLNPLQQKEFERNKLIGGGLGVAGSVLGGSGGAQDLLVGGAQAVADKIIPGLGKAIGPIMEALAKGPDAVKSFIRDFVKSVPVLITNLVEAIPAVGEALLEQVPVLFNSLIASLPRLINSLVNQMPTVASALAAQAPFIAANMAMELVRQAPNIAVGIAKGAYEAIKNILSSLNPFSGGGGGSFLSNIPLIGGLFAEGGYVKKVPNGFPMDSFPARLTEGEFVVDRSTSKKLETFLNSQNDNSSILIQILNAVSTPMTIESNVQVNQQTFANIILELSRQNRRLTV